MRSLAVCGPPIEGLIPINLVQMVQLMALQQVHGILAPAGMDDDGVQHFTQLDEVGPDAAHRSDNLRRLALEDADEPGNFPLRQNLKDDIGLL
ncbi:hypothetical protein D3C71_2004350 [compost metagenome]